MAGKLLVSRNVNKAAEVNSALSPNVGSFGWTSYEAGHFNQLLEYVNFVKENAAILEGQIAYIDLRISDAEKALQNVYKALENTVLKYDDFVVRYEAMLIYLDQIRSMYDQIQTIVSAFKRAVQEDNYNGFFELQPNDAEYFHVTLNAASTTLNIASWGLVSGVNHFTLFVKQGTGDNEVTWDTSIKWPQGSEPTISTDIDHVDVFEFTTVDGGGTWYASVFGRDYS